MSLLTRLIHTHDPFYAARNPFFATIDSFDDFERIQRDMLRPFQELGVVAALPIDHNRDEDVEGDDATMAEAQPQSTQEGTADTTSEANNNNAIRSQTTTTTNKQVSRTAGNPANTVTWVRTVPIDVIETSDAVLVKAEMPGLVKENIDIQLDDNVLTLRGTRNEEHEVKDAKRHVYERRAQTFSRSIVLPECVDFDKDVGTKFENGVVEISFARKQLADKRKKIKL
jgi:HSP20 family protein